MKKSAVFVIATLLWSCNPAPSEKEEASELTETTEAVATGNFGAEVEESNVYTIAQMYETLETKGDFEGKVIGEIKEVCAHKGCWMTVELPDGQLMRVTFKDYGFFVPKNAMGYPVIMDGVATRSITDVASQKHYAEDAGKSKEEIDAITSDKEEYKFEAVGVIIKENA
ncbi:hypothetical protein P872_20110 [Rhodonellum psychrophilum GCM71 = DSM 17998]|uniref:Branched-chain amino acid aminotransferase n=2 Tax=Rhodonellum TaxID=336827 RepID=U5BUN6_9BACT|nr:MULTISPECIES: DUF4920 domain-containing protein [Rhodonellum]ERM81593.1 hypothetical protein P872_20110 [Rhodonellum psychrophilum GCM71 = DSM 17998]SDZ37012.1 protein of unknown function [Rhodonellum ikkaensis]